MSLSGVLGVEMELSILTGGRGRGRGTQKRELQLQGSSAPWAQEEGSLRRGLTGLAELSPFVVGAVRGQAGSLKETVEGSTSL